MKKYVVLILAVLTVPLVSLADKGGNGGGTLICPVHGGLFKKTVILDLYEAARDGLKMSPDKLKGSFDERVNAEIERALGRLQVLNPSLAKSTKDMIPHIQQVRRPVPPGKSLPPPTDTEVDYLDKKCVLTGAFRYNDQDDYLEIDDSHFKKLDSRNTAALWVHETTYKVLRTANLADDSVNTRKIVGYLFSGENQPKPEVLDFLKAFKFFKCATQALVTNDPFPDGFQIVSSKPSLPQGSTVGALLSNMNFMWSKPIFSSFSLDYAPVNCRWEIDKSWWGKPEADVTIYPDANYSYFCGYLYTNGAVANLTGEKAKRQWVSRVPKGAVTTDKSDGADSFPMGVALGSGDPDSWGTTKSEVPNAYSCSEIR